MAQGKRAGTRRKRSFDPALLALALGVTASVVAWGYLVVSAIDFGAAARDGDGAAWWFLALASLGAVACLFVALILVARISRAIGLTRGPTPPDASEPSDPLPSSDQAAPARPSGGRRIRE